MLDLALFAFICGFLVLGLRAPFLWVMAYLYIDILAPQKIGWALMQIFPISLITFCAAFGGWLFADPKKRWTISSRQVLLALFLVYCGYTTMVADFPEDALAKWDWVWKAMIFAIFLPLTLTTRLRIEGVILTMILTLGAIVISGGIKTTLAGGGYGQLYLFVNDNSGIYESSIIACFAIAVIPLILWAMKHSTIFPPEWRVRLFGFALIFACLLIPVGTEARTGLVCIAVLGVMLLRDVKRRLTFMVAGAALGIAALPFLPPSFYERMGTITSHEGDQSASTRLAVWGWTLDYVADKPMGGGFDAYRGNSFTYKMPVREESEIHTNTETTTMQEVTDESRAYHSAYFEILGEQGWPGMLLWLSIHFLGLFHMERLRRRWRTSEDENRQWIAPLATSLQMAHVIYMVGAVFVGIGYQPFVMMIIGVQTGLWLYSKQIDSPVRGARRAAGHPRRAQGHGNAVAAREAALR